MSTLTAHIKSYGCQMNKLGTALVIAAIEKAGFKFTDDVKEADVVLINTCSVRQHAEQRVLSYLGHLKHIKMQNPNLNAAESGANPQLVARTATDWIVVFNGPPSLAGRFANLKITKSA